MPAIVASRQSKLWPPVKIWQIQPCFQLIKSEDPSEGYLGVVVHWLQMIATLTDVVGKRLGPRGLRSATVVCDEYFAAGFQPPLQSVSSSSSSSSLSNIGDTHRRSQDFLCGGGALFFPRKVDALFPLLVVALKTHAKTTKLTTSTVQISPISSKNWTLALPGRLHALPWGCTYNFPLKCAPPHFFSALRGARAPSTPPGYTYGDTKIFQRTRSTLYIKTGGAARNYVPQHGAQKYRLAKSNKHFPV